MAIKGAHDWRLTVDLKGTVAGSFDNDNQCRGGFNSTQFD